MDVAGVDGVDGIDEVDENEAFEEMEEVDEVGEFSVAVDTASSNPDATGRRVGGPGSSAMRCADAACTSVARPSHARAVTIAAMVIATAALRVGRDGAARPAGRAAW